MTKLDPRGSTSMLVLDSCNKAWHSALLNAAALLLLAAAAGCSVNLQRYVCWMHTTPAVMYLIKSVSNSITTQQVGGQACCTTQHSSSSSSLWVFHLPWHCEAVMA